MKFIELADVLLFHEKIIDKTGGGKGVRDIGLIESALSRAFVTFDGVELYGSIISKVSATVYSLIRNHGFIDGNKRIGIAVMLLLLQLNHINISFTQEELVKLGLGIASGLINETQISSWIEEHIRNKT